jgi:formylglycine-generating enzyme required for sulfatase activity
MLASGEPKGRPFAVMPVAAAIALPLAVIALASWAAAQEPAVPETVAIPAGSFVAGSDEAEREYAYRLDERAYGHDVTRQQGWYDRERARGPAETGAYEIAVAPVTNDQYAAFVAATGRPAPDVGRETWEGYGLIHDYEATRRFAWPDGRPPEGRGDHPVVLVAHADAVAYAAWLSAETGEIWRLPTELEWEKAARGTDGRYFPWGDGWDGTRLNTNDGGGPYDTTPVGAFPDGASPFGLLDPAGQVYEWTATPRGEGRYIVKGGSWDDSGCGVCRPAARHGRPEAIRHIIVGFRLVREPGPDPVGDPAD